MLSTKHQSELAPLMDAEGRLEKLIDAQKWFRPHKVWLEQEKLVWVHEPLSRPPEMPHGAEGLLQDFLELADAPDEKILRYARRWGVLGICQHNLPCTHAPGNLRFPRQMGCWPRGWDRDEWAPKSPPRGVIQCWDTLEPWRQFAGEAMALLKIAEKVHRSKAGEVEDWQIVNKRQYQYLPPKGAVDKHALVEIERGQLSAVLNEWLHLGNVRLETEWHVEQNSPSLRFNCGLFGVLALQLMLVAAKVDGFAMCSACARPYVPRRRLPKRGQRHFCLKCRKGGLPKKFASRDYKERQRKTSH